MQKKIPFVFVFAAAVLAARAQLPTPTTAFTYQGMLTESGTNVNGSLEMAFRLYDSVTNGNEIGSVITNVTTVTGGYFTATLDFGSGAFNGFERWLEISINSSNGNQTLAPRQAVLPAPYAQFANAAASINTSAWIQDQNGTITSSNNWSVGPDLPDTTDLVFSANDIPAMVLDADGNVSIESSLNLSDWTVTTNTFQDTDDCLSISNNDSLRFLLAPDSAKNADNDQIGMIVVGDSEIQGRLTITNQLNASGGIHVGSGATGLDWDTDGSLYCSNIDLNGGLSINGVITVFPSGGGFETLEIYDDGTIWAPNYEIGSDGAITSYSGITATGDIRTSGDMYAADIYAGNLNSSSDRNAKENFAPVSVGEVLDKVAALPITRWTFKTDPGTHHVGPMAQDFYNAFNVGSDDRHIAVVDEGGVALAAIQGLDQKLEAEAKAKNKKIEDLEKRLADLEALIKPPASKPSDAHP